MYMHVCLCKCVPIVIKMSCLILSSVPPILTNFPSTVRDVVSGETLTASCDASADPAPVIQWFKGDQQLNNGDPDGVSISQRTEGTTTSSQLTVTGLTPEDIGVYSCVAVNDLGKDSRSFQVNAIGESPTVCTLVCCCTWSTLIKNSNNSLVGCRTNPAHKGHGK